MKLTKTIKNWKQFVMDMSSYLELEPSHLHIHLQIDLQMLKRKLLVRFIALPKLSLYKWQSEAHDLCFVFHIAYAIYRTCDI